MFREINPNRGTITLNVNVLNIPIKSQRFSKWIKILKTQLNTAHKRQPLNIQMQKDWKSKDRKKYTTQTPT